MNESLAAVNPIAPMDSEQETTPPKERTRLSRLRTSIRRNWFRLSSFFVVVAHIAGALTSVRAVMETRTPQGAVAWAVSLNTFPYVAVPAYWVFGRDKFKGYIVARREDNLRSSPMARQLEEALRSERLALEETTAQNRLLEMLSHLPFTRRNHASLLVDGEATFRSIFEAIEQARDYVLVEFYILRDDGIGRQLRDLLIRKAGEGVRCHVLYDELGSIDLPPDYPRALEDAGVKVSRFNTTKGPTNRFQLNFRNHRKIVVVDGRTAFVGGLNVGDEYLGKDPDFGDWRDTHVRLTGPIVQCVQIPWIEDWNWATGEIVRGLNWDPEESPDGDMAALALPSGPADEFETCTLFFLDAITQARERLWIATPYFVPDEQIVSALRLAALRGVDVRIIIPEESDSMLVYLSSFSYLKEAEQAGVRTFRYGRGFMHQKTMLVDDHLSFIGTANFDNRSFRLNFEITVVVDDPGFARETEAMLLADLEECREVKAGELEERAFPFRLAVRVARLMAPIQ